MSPRRPIYSNISGTTRCSIVNHVMPAEFHQLLIVCAMPSLHDINTHSEQTQTISPSPLSAAPNGTEPARIVSTCRGHGDPVRQLPALCESCEIVTAETRV